MHVFIGLQMKRVWVTLVSLLIIGAIGFAGWQSRQDKPNNDPSANQNQQSQQAFNKSDDSIKLVGGEVALPLPENFIEATGGYYSKESGICGQDVTSDVECLDHTMFVLKDEGFFNADQFQVNVAVFKKNNAKSSKEWFIEDVLGVEGDSPWQEDINIQGRKAFKQIVLYGPNEARFAYAVVSDKYGVLLRSTVFSGNHYSYENNKSYSNYNVDVEKIAKSIVIKD